MWSTESLNSLCNDFSFQTSNFCLNYSILFNNTFFHVLKAAREGSLTYPLCWKARVSRLSFSVSGFQPLNRASFFYHIKHLNSVTLLQNNLLPFSWVSKIDQNFRSFHQKMLLKFEHSSSAFVFPLYISITLKISTPAASLGTGITSACPALCFRCWDWLAPATGTQ